MLTDVLFQIASSPLNYGFYHSYPYEHYEKRSLDTWPLSNIVPITPKKEKRNPNPWPNSEQTKSDNQQKQNKESDRKHIVVENTDKKGQYLISSEAKVFPVYPGTLTGEFNLNVPSPVDLTTTPGEVQADYALELPYNGLRFQSPSSVVSS